MQRFILLFSILSSLFLGSCVRLREIPVREEFCGLKNCVSEETPMSIFISHGMAGFSPDDPQHLIRGIRNFMHLHPAGRPCVREIKRGDKLYGYLERQDYTRGCSGAPVHIYTLDWRAATWDQKSAIRRIDENSQIIGYRSKHIHKIKKTFTNSGMADLSLYSGPYATEMMFPFEQAIGWIIDDTEDLPDHHIAVITFSLGTQLIVDTLDQMNEDHRTPATKVARERFIDQIFTFFMMSNVFPLLYLTDVPAPYKESPVTEGPVCLVDPYWDAHQRLEEPDEIVGSGWYTSPLTEFMEEKRKKMPHFRIVAFSDPNDLLSFKVCEIDQPSSEQYFRTVFVRNVKKEFFGYIINPEKAHQGYGTNPKVLSLITHGYHPACPADSCSCCEICDVCGSEEGEELPPTP